MATQIKVNSPANSQVNYQKAREAVSSLTLKGTPGQIKWAESIIQKSLDVIEEVIEAGLVLPVKASFWIDNQSSMDDPVKLAQAFANLSSIRDYGVTEDEKKEALRFMESLSIEGSAGQLKWVKEGILNDLDTDNSTTLELIAYARRIGVSIPSKASFWIDNRTNLFDAFLFLEVIKELNITAEEKSDAVVFADKIDLIGVSDKQISFARSVINENTEAIAYALKVGAQIPNQASFWCDNKKNIWGALGLLESN